MSDILEIAREALERLHKSRFGPILTHGEGAELAQAVIDQAAEVARLIAERDALKLEHGWIPVGQQLPDAYERVLLNDAGTGHIHIGYKVAFIAQWSTVEGLFFQAETYCWITHWRPLPAPPEGEA